MRCQLCKTEITNTTKRVCDNCGVVTCNAHTCGEEPTPGQWTCTNCITSAIDFLLKPHQDPEHDQ